VTSACPRRRPPAPAPCDCRPRAPSTRIHGRRGSASNRGNRRLGGPSEAGALASAGDCSVNLSKEDVILTRIRVLSKHVLVSAGESPQQMAEGLLRTPFMTIIPAGGQATFPIVVKDGALMDDDCRDVVPFIIVVSWRKTRAMWLPQPPKFLFSSVRALRRLNRAKTGQRPSAKA
jgi:hypothetical protein